jgi:hypothetical protein
LDGHIPMTTPKSDAPPSRTTWGPRRLLAAIVLPPAAILLLVSIAALALFYSSPARFNTWLSRLPGDDLIRTALIFAPATLMAVVVMAILYAVEAPGREAAEATRPIPRRQGVRARERGRWARRSLWLSVPAIIIVASAHLVDFIAPTRFEAILDALPATGILTRIYTGSPVIVLAAVGLGLIFGFAPAAETGALLERPGGPSRMWTTQRIGRLGAILTMVPALALLALSVGGWVLVLPSPARLSWLADRLPAETLLRLGLLFVPAMLLGVVLLAGLYLAFPGPGARTTEATAEPVGRDFRSGLAVGVLLAGLGFTALAGIAVLLSVVFVLAAR